MRPSLQDTATLRSFRNQDKHRGDDSDGEEEQQSMVQVIQGTISIREGITVADKSDSKDSKKSLPNGQERGREETVTDNDQDKVEQTAVSATDLPENKGEETKTFDGKLCMTLSDSFVETLTNLGHQQSQMSVLLDMKKKMNGDDDDSNTNNEEPNPQQRQEQQQQFCIPSLCSNRPIDMYNPFKLVPLNSGKRRALLIGISSEELLRKVQFFLQSECNFLAQHMLTFSDNGFHEPPTKENLLKGMTKFSKYCKRSDVAFVYYRCNLPGIAVEDMLGGLAPVDIKKEGLVTEREIRQYLLDNIPCHVTLLLDGPWFGSGLSHTLTANERTCRKYVAANVKVLCADSIMNEFLLGMKQTAGPKGCSWKQLVKEMDNPQLQACPAFDPSVERVEIVPVFGGGILKKRRALLIGIDYDGSDKAHESVEKMKEYLMFLQGFRQDDIYILKDDGEHTLPTRDNIIKAMQDFCSMTKSGDIAFVYVTGIVDQNALMPLDYNKNENNTLTARRIVRECMQPMPEGCTMTCLFEGGILNFGLPFSLPELPPRSDEDEDDDDRGGQPQKQIEELEVSFSDVRNRDLSDDEDDNGIDATSGHESVNMLDATRLFNMVQKNVNQLLTGDDQQSLDGGSAHSFRRVSSFSPSAFFGRGSRAVAKRSSQSEDEEDDAAAADELENDLATEINIISTCCTDCEQTEAADEESSPGIHLGGLATSAGFLTAMKNTDHGHNLSIAGLLMQIKSSIRDSGIKRLTPILLSTKPIDMYHPLEITPDTHKNGTKRALLVGVSHHHRKKAKRRSNNCLPQLQEMAQFLTGRLGFKEKYVHMMVQDHDRHEEPTRINILSSLSLLCRNTDPGDVVFLYFVSRGNPDLRKMKSKVGKNTIFPSDFRSAGPILGDDVHDRLVKNLPPFVKLTCILDGTVDDTLVNMPYSFVANDSIQYTPATVRLVSVSLDSTSASHSVTEGLFTDAFLTAIKTGGVTWEELLKMMRVSIKEKLKNDMGGEIQLPLLSSSRSINIRRQVVDIIPSIFESGDRHALLIGVSYKGKKKVRELQSSHRNVYKLKNYLREEHEFLEDNFTLLMDDGFHTCPTRENILGAFGKITKSAKSGDVVFIHFAGHGTQTRNQWAKKQQGADEIGGECLLPCDFDTDDIVRDVEIERELVKNFADGVLVTCLFDCCNSGSMFPLQFQYNAKKRHFKRKGSDLGRSEETKSVALETGGEGKSNMQSFFGKLSTGLLKKNRTNVLVRTSSDLGADPSNPQNHRSGGESNVSATVFLFSACEEDGKASGAVTGGVATNVFLEAMYEHLDNPTSDEVMTVVSLLLSMRRSILKLGLKQKPQLTSSRPVDIHDRMEIVPESHQQGTRRALLIGINYVRTQSVLEELEGSHRDVMNVMAFLQGRYSFQKENCIILMDDGIHKEPTHQNIIQAFDDIASLCGPEDSVFFYFSGLGGQAFDRVSELNENLGFDETIYPSDVEQMGPIRDVTLHTRFVLALPHGTRMTALVDCSHSGSMLGLDFKFADDAQATKYIPATFRCIAGCQDTEESNGNPLSGGLSTSAFVDVMTRAGPDITWIHLLHGMRSLVQQLLREATHDDSITQTPHLSSSRFIDVKDKINIIPPNFRGNRHALIIGITYMDKEEKFWLNPLPGCLKDVEKMKRFLSQKCGFYDEDFTILLDDGQNISPTRDNILAALRSLPDVAAQGDVVFVYFSGHGGRVQDQVIGGDEEDGYDECIFPVDCKNQKGVIRDDDIFDLLVKPMPEGVIVTSFFDCSHSGSIMDLPYEYQLDNTAEFMGYQHHKTSANQTFGDFISRGIGGRNSTTRIPSFVNNLMANLKGEQVPEDKRRKRSTLSTKRSFGLGL